MSRILRRSVGAVSPALFALALVHLTSLAAWAQDLAVVSAASYEPVVAPDSLAAVFGQGLASTVLSAELDESGQLPTELGGTSVEIDGKLAGLIFVSPGQINLVVPADTEPGGDREVIVTTNSSRLVGRARVERIAPALISVDSSGTGPGAIVNALTFALAPFKIETEENPPSDKRTRLALFGTGMRMSPEERTAAPTASQDLIELASVRAFDESGNLYELAVEYVGSAPGFFGLDQANVVLDESLDGVGKLTLEIQVGSAISNQVTTVVHYLEPPIITSVTPSTVSPGAELMIEGIRFGSFYGDTVQLRTIVTFEVNGSRFPAIPLGATKDRISVMTPLIPVEDSSYQGPTRVCVTVDGRQSCHEPVVTLMPLETPDVPVGETLLEFNRQILANSLQAAMLTAKAGEITRKQQEMSELLGATREIIEAAKQGEPLTISYRNLDGTEDLIPLDLATIELLESLIVAGPSPPKFDLPERAQTTRAEGVGQNVPGDQAADKELSGLLYLSWVNTAQYLENYSRVKYTYQALGCVAALLPAGLTGCIETANKVGLALTFLQGAAIINTFTELVTRETQPIFLNSLRARPSPVIVDAGESTDVEVVGQFVGKQLLGKQGSLRTRAQQFADELVGIAVNVVLSGQLEGLDEAGVLAVVEGSERFAEQLVDRLLSQFFPELGSLPSSEFEDVLLTSRYLEIVNSEYSFDISLRPPGERAALRVAGLNQTVDRQYAIVRTILADPQRPDHQWPTVWASGFVVYTNERDLLQGRVSGAIPVEVVGDALRCAPYAQGFVPFDSVYYVSDPNSSGDRLLVGEFVDHIERYGLILDLPAPAFDDQKYCGEVELAPGCFAEAYVPTQSERQGDFSPFANVFFDPLISGERFPAGILPTSRIPDPFAWRIVSARGCQ